VKEQRNMNTGLRIVILLITIVVIWVFIPFPFFIAFIGVAILITWLGHRKEKEGMKKEKLTSGS
jgi:hypothetical protein